MILYGLALMVLGWFLCHRWYDPTTDKPSWREVVAFLVSVSGEALTAIGVAVWLFGLFF